MPKLKKITNPTLKQIRDFIDSMPKKRLSDNLALYDVNNDEYFTINSICLSCSEDDVLDGDSVVVEYIS